MKARCFIITLLSLLVPFLIDAAGAAKGDVYIVKVADAIGPAIAEFIDSSIARAEKEQAACTGGGLCITARCPGGFCGSHDHHGG
jgi:membrane-bound ClpP family serine protease